ncbi:hypothetical protein [Enterobacter hormaechei]|uniref:hypothetical protein n=1 Tax=Enterobacter hormaechei TaxID=158836 RepID=UPI0012817B68|nr:hypothetical protein FZN37_004346 [Enterobacter hormaechei]
MTTQALSPWLRLLSAAERFDRGPYFIAIRRGLARQCLAWTERTHHLAGPPGVQFLRRLCDAGWMLRARDSRAVLVMPKGWQELHQRLGVDEATVRSEAEHRHA